MVKINFQKQFGKGTDPWYAKAERWVKKKFKNPYIQHLALGFVALLKKIWIEGKIQMEMASVDEQVKRFIKVGMVIHNLELNMLKQNQR